MPQRAYVLQRRVAASRGYPGTAERMVFNRNAVAPFALEKINKTGATALRLRDLTGPFPRVAALLRGNPGLEVVAPLGQGSASNISPCSP